MLCLTFSTHDAELYIQIAPFWFHLSKQVDQKSCLFSCSFASMFFLEYKSWVTMKNKPNRFEQCSV